ncbi:bifunctional 4-hydroxy-2-oxoglutarate aldolase/2-dehydro-3-deoxy-phosphogluconate aldolase [Marinilactibacillus psychrotolerans]|uniref:2-dehydro-3-deoxyphosphogluconate aldolase n=1 Tax=Marinilactibacillus psychrotolerans TaxID=191770 RepID=A0A5R9C128_9LACT|nr:2-dehydro-3-deoxyphosphogluconate aldolase [Marinilactibacillus psychrotolerans]TLQ06400.1 2-dehydro-3-deoxyphosphogluconate aldolase [Marinilactibacillus psychrotolerans]
MNINHFPTVTVIFRGFSKEQVIIAIEQLEKSKREYAVEITLNSPDAFTTIKAASKKYGERMWIGAGTVKNLEEAKKAIDSGAKFILSPIALDKETLNYCKDKEIVTVPSGLTPTEVWKLVEDGADIIKIFPAASVAIDHMKALKGPLGDLPLMAVGGINKNNAKAYLMNGAKYLGVGSSLFKKEDIENKNIEGLEQSLREFEEAIY